MQAEEIRGKQVAYSLQMVQKKMCVCKGETERQRACQCGNLLSADESRWKEMGIILFFKFFFLSLKNVINKVLGNKRNKEWSMCPVLLKIK